MKRILFTLLFGVILLGFGSAYACHPETGIGCNDTTVQVPTINTSGTGAIAQNGQLQTQTLNVQNLGINGGISSLGQNQAGTGSTGAQLGSTAYEGQQQGENTSQTLSNLAAVHDYNSTLLSAGNSSVPSGPGKAFHGEFQSADLAIGTLSDAGGTASLAGSTMLIDQCVVAGAVNGTAAGGVLADSHSQYSLVNNGPNSNILQAGSQDAQLVTAAGVGFDTTGAGGANLQASQVGGTAALNDGAGTSMIGGGNATGSIVAENGSTPNAFAGSTGSQGQIHSYTQDAGLGTNQSQWSSGVVSTGNTVDSGTILPGYGLPAFNN